MQDGNSFWTVYSESVSIVLGDSGVSTITVVDVPPREDGVNMQAS